MGEVINKWHACPSSYNRNPIRRRMGKTGWREEGRERSEETGGGRRRRRRQQEDEEEEEEEEKNCRMCLVKMFREDIS